MPASLDLTAFATRDYWAPRSELGLGGHGKPGPSQAEVLAGHEPIVYPVVPDCSCLDDSRAPWRLWLSDAIRRF